MYDLMNGKLVIASSTNNFVYDDQNKWWSDGTEPPHYFCDTDKVFTVTEITPPPTNGAPNVVS